MKSLQSFFFLFLFLVCFSCRPAEEESALFGEAGLNASGSALTLSELLGDRVKITPLETTQESLIGKINKIKSFRGEYFVLTQDRWILRFDSTGNYLSSLRKSGGGPDEYSTISDFDVYTHQNRIEVWICDAKAIKIYDPEDFSLIRSVKFPFVVHKFLRIDENRILLLTGQNNQSLTLCDREGRVIKRFLDREIPFLMFKYVQFIPVDLGVSFQLGVSNAVILYDPLTDSFRKRSLVKNGSLLSDRDLLDLFRQYSTDFPREFNRYSYIKNFRKLGSKVFMDVSSGGERYFTVFDGHSEKTVHYFPSPESLSNDLFGTEDFEFLTTFGIGDSDHSIILYAMPSAFTEGRAGLKTLKREDNPVLIEFF